MIAIVPPSNGTPTLTAANPLQAQGKVPTPDGTSRDGPVVRGVVLAAGPTGAVVELGGRIFLIEGAARLPVGAPVTVRTSAEIVAGGGGSAPGWLVNAGGRAEGCAVPIRLSPATLPEPEPAVLPPRPGPVLPAILSSGGGTAGHAVEVRVALTPPPNGSPPPAPPGGPPDPARAAATLAALAGAMPVAAVVLPRRPGGGISLALDGGAVLHVRDLAIGVPDGGFVGVRVLGLDRDAGEVPTRAKPGSGEAIAGEVANTPRRLPADASLGAALLALADEADPPPDAGGPPLLPDQPASRQETAGPTFHALLGEPEHPCVVSLTWEDDGGQSSADDGATGRLVIETTFDRLGRVRLEVDRPGAELRLVVRADHPLPGAARAELLDLAGAAFEFGGTRARLVLATGGLPAPMAAARPATLA